MNYSFSKDGIVFGRDGQLKAKKTKRGYLIFRLYGHGEWQTVHKAVWVHFNGPIPQGLQINHINGVKTDNRLENLELVTASENIKHAYKLGMLSQKGIKNNQAKLCNNDIKKIRELYQPYKYGYKKLAKQFQVSPSLIYQIITKRIWPHV
jgi:hypothetical protein